MLLIMALSITGCDLLSKKNENVYKEVKYADLSNIYTKTYYDLIPASLHNEEVVNNYKNLDVMEVASELINGGYEENIPLMPVFEYLTPSVLIPSDLSDLTFDTLGQNVGFIGPVEMVYSNLASVQYMLQLIQEMNQEFEEYGTIEFDGTEIVIPGSEFPVIPDPLKPGEDIQFGDIKAKFSSEGNVSTILVHSINSYEYSDVSIGTFTGEVGLYLKVAILMTKDNIATITIDFYVTCDLSAQGKITSTNSNDTGSIHYQIGQSIKAIDNHSIVINSDVQSSVKLELIDNNYMEADIPDIDETISVKTSFILLKTSDGIVSDYKVTTDAIDEAEINYHLTSDADESILYVEGSLSDADFYGEDIPAQSFDGVFVYDRNSQIIFIGAHADLNIPQYDMYENYIETTPVIYSGYIWNLKDLTGWTSLKETVNEYNTDLIYTLYNGDTVLLDIEDQQGTFEDDGETLIEGKAILAGAVSIDATAYNGAAYLHMKQGNTINIDLPGDMTSTNYDRINDLFSDLSVLKNAISIDFEIELYQVPTLQKDLFE